ncbi:unnamed protein product, partial [Ectocarpus sp. 12 AP-2014]
RILAFTRDWLSRSPYSSHAMVARARALANAGLALRGQGPARDIYPEALRRFLDLHAEAFALAESAYQSDPYFLPATDAIMELGLTTGRQASAYEILAATMRRQPNWETLERALNLVNPAYGGVLEDVSFLCGKFGPMIEDGPSDNMARYCKIIAMQKYFRDGNAQVLSELLQAEPAPELDRIRVQLALWTY